MAIALVGATVHTGQGPPLENATIVIDGARVHAVGAKLRPPDGATVIDVSGMVITPGLVAVGTRLGTLDVELESASVEATLPAVGRPGSRGAARGRHLEPRLAHRADRARGRNHVRARDARRRTDLGSGRLGRPGREGVAAARLGGAPRRDRRAARRHRPAARGRALGLVPAPARDARRRAPVPRQPRPVPHQQAARALDLGRRPRRARPRARPRPDRRRRSRPRLRHPHRDRDRRTSTAFAW